MRTIPLCISLGAAAVLAACGGYEPVAPAPTAVITNPSVPPAAVVVTPAPPLVQQGAVQGAVAGSGVVVPALRPGMARVESVTPLASTTPSGESATQPLRRVGLRMDDGTAQFVDTRANVVVGDRVEITPDAHMRTPVAQGPTPARN